MEGNTLMTLLVKLGINSDDLIKGLDLAEKKANTTGSKIVDGLSQVGHGAVLGAAVAAGAAFAALGAGVAFSLKEAMAAQEGQAKLNAVIEATGGVAGVTAKMANDLAESFQKTTKFEDDVTLGGESMLLTFKNIGKDVFPQATEAMLNMASMMGGDVQGSAIQLGKALNDPMEGISALTRVGVTFSDEQKAVIKALQEAGDMAGAQGVILAELQSEFGGVAVAAGSTFSGQLTILKNTLGSVAESVGMKLLPAFENLMTNVIMPAIPQIQAFTEKVGGAVVGFVTNVITWIPQAVATFQGIVAFLQNNEGIIVGVLVALGVAIGVFVYTTVIPAAIAAIAALAPIVLPILAIGAAVALLYSAWTKDWGGIRTFLTGVWDNNIKPIFETLKTWLEVNLPKAFNTIKGVVEKIGEVFTRVFGAISGAISGVIGWVAKAVKAITDFWNNIPKALRPGSPTPFELGIRGINDAISNMGNLKIPDLSAKLNLTPNANIGARVNGNGGAATRNQYFNQTVYTNAPSSTVIGDFAMLKARA